MIRIKEEVDFEESEVKGKMATCPVCGQKLGEVRYVNGILLLIIKCRRCKHYIHIHVEGN